jgi:hypothetical protein
LGWDDAVVTKPNEVLEIAMLDTIPALVKATKPASRPVRIVRGDRRKRPAALLLKKRLSQHQDLSLILDNQDGGHAKIPQPMC